VLEPVVRSRRGFLATAPTLISNARTLGWGGVVLNFQTRVTSTGFDLGTWSWSANGSAFAALPGVNTATRNTAFRFLVPLISVPFQRSITPPTSSSVIH
jgi:hypothetical protein